MHIVHKLIGEDLVVVTSFPPDADVADALADAQASPVGKGNPFYAFAELTGEVVDANFASATVCSNKRSENQSAIDGMLANPPLSNVTFG